MRWLQSKIQESELMGGKKYQGANGSSALHFLLFTPLERHRLLLASLMLWRSGSVVTTAISRWGLMLPSAGRETPVLTGFTSRHDRRGFTLVEAAVILAMLLLIAAIVLASFPSLSQRINIQRSSQGLALAFRKAQNMALAVRQVEVAPGDRRIPRAYGLYFTRSAADSYILFADFRAQTDPSFGIYDPSNPGITFPIQSIPFNQGISISSLVSATNGPESVLNIAFSVPEARVYIQNASLPAGQSAEIFLAGRTPTYIRSVLVRTSGQIRIK